MRIIDLFDEYFLMLIYIEIGILIFIDNRDFKKNNMVKETKISKIVGIGTLSVSTVLYILRLIIV